MNKFSLFIFIFCNSFVSYCQDSIGTKKILIVATNIDQLGNNENGTYFVEIAFPFQHFIEAGFEVDVLTPKGGQTALYPNEKHSPELNTIITSEKFIFKTKHSLSPEEVNAKDYVAVFYPGGYGQFFDVVENIKISKLCAAIYEKGGVIGTAGHGAASLINIKLSNGDYLVKNKTMTCFPHWFEVQNMWQSDYGKLMPFDMQEILIRRGAKMIVCEENAMKNTCGQVVDEKNRIVTGALADDALWVARETTRMLSTKR